MNSSNVSSQLYHNNTREDCVLNVDIISVTVTNLLTGLPLNIYMLWVIITGPAQTLASCFLELNMALCEILFGALSPSNFVNACKYPSAGRTEEYVSVFSYGILLFGRPLFQSLVCVERYVAVVYPVVFLKYRALRYKFICSALGWLIVLKLSLILAFYREMTEYILPVQTLILIMVKLFCFLSVLRALKQPQPGDGEREREMANQAKMRAVKVILILLVSTIVHYVPLALVLFLEVFLPKLESLDIATNILLCTVMSIGVIQPLLFLRRTRKCIWGCHFKQHHARDNVLSISRYGKKSSG